MKIQLSYAQFSTMLGSFALTSGVFTQDLQLRVDLSDSEMSTVIGAGPSLATAGLTFFPAFYTLDKNSNVTKLVAFATGGGSSPYATKILFVIHGSYALSSIPSAQAAACVEVADLLE